LQRSAPALILALAGALAPFASPGTASTIRVPEDASGLVQAIARAGPGDTILLGPGIYRGGAVVPRSKRGLTIVGADRNRVVLDGRDVRKNGIAVYADAVAILNMSAHNFRRNGFFWKDADGFRASYLTVWNVEGYGIYTEGSSGGTIDHDYVSGAADAAYYVGECRRCDATISDSVATLSAVGYSGTNASGVVIRNSRWTWNGAGILPNTYANEEDPPQERATIVGNTVLGSGSARVPITTPLAGFIGIGIAIAGGNANVVRGNRVEQSERYGIAVFPTARRIVFDPAREQKLGPPWRPRGNRILRNDVSGSRRADLVLAAGSGDGNCFLRNSADSTLPQTLQQSGCASRGDPTAARELTAPVRTMVEATIRRRNPPPYTEMPVPPPQPSMPRGFAWTPPR
jgi:hypothetical protein